MDAKNLIDQIMNMLCNLQDALDGYDIIVDDVGYNIDYDDDEMSEDLVGVEIYKFKNLEVAMLGGDIYTYEN